VDFEKIDTVFADSIETGDIIEDEGEFFLIHHINDEGEMIEFSVESLSNIDGDETILAYPYVSFGLYRSY